MNEYNTRAIETWLEKVRHKGPNYVASYKRGLMQVIHRREAKDPNWRMLTWQDSMERFRDEELPSEPSAETAASTPAPAAGKAPLKSASSATRTTSTPTKSGSARTEITRAPRALSPLAFWTRG